MSMPKWAKPVFNNEIALPSAAGWCMFNRRGRPHSSPEKTRRCLLIGYDMIPLRGLEKTAVLLRDRYGLVPRRCRLRASDGDGCWTLAMRGRLSLSAASYPVHHDCAARAFSAACGWLVHARRNSLTEDEYKALMDVWWTVKDRRWPWRAEHRRQRRRYERQAAKAAAVIGRLGIHFCRATIELVRRQAAGAEGK